MDIKNKINKNQVRIFELIQSEKKKENKKEKSIKELKIFKNATKIFVIKIKNKNRIIF